MWLLCLVPAGPQGATNGNGSPACDKLASQVKHREIGVFSVPKGQRHHLTLPFSEHSWGHCVGLAHVHEGAPGGRCMGLTQVDEGAPEELGGGGTLHGAHPTWMKEHGSGGTLQSGDLCAVTTWTVQR